jgi:BlaI family penicillinase repressor
MNKVPRISEAEWSVMKAVWAKAPCSAEEVLERLVAAGKEWHPKTMRSLLNRLVKKKALTYEKLGRAYLYAPTVSEVECVSAASESFLLRIFAGSLKPMLAHFVEQKKLSASEIRELRELLNKSEGKR